jgi:hypothetical protein
VKPIILGLTALSLVAASIRTDEQTALPKGPQPQQVLAWLEGQDLLIQKTETRFVPETRQRAVKTNDGRIVTVTETVTVPVQTTYRQKWKAQNVRVYRADGKEVNLKANRKLLDRATPVLLSADGKKVDQFYLQIMKEGTLVLVPPRQEAGPIPLPKLPMPLPPDKKPK